MASSSIDKEHFDLICVGGGIMSATLALMLKMIDPAQKVLIVERLENVASESTAAWNNSGTGHSAFCELNYTPKNEAGQVETDKAERIFNQFQRSRQFWSHLVDRGWIDHPEDFIRRVPHYSWVKGKELVTLLRKRFEALQSIPAFADMNYTEDRVTMREWFPLMMMDRNNNEPMAATQMKAGTEVNFENITKKCFAILEQEFNTPVYTSNEVLDVDPQKREEWLVKVKNVKTGDTYGLDAHHVFIGAGGGALPLLQKVEIEEKEGYGGFPVSGQWLVCKNQELAHKHHAKVYSKVGVDAPPMAAPHLDTRFVNGQKELMFGPFAGFSTKFLKEGSYLDLPKSLRLENIPSYWGAFWHNLDLTGYLIKQITMDHEDRMEQLRDFIPGARSEDWELKIAGQRVQVIKKDEDKGGNLEFGTDVVHSKDGSITALLGASPGASTAVHIMLKVLQHAYPDKMQSNKWQNQIREMIPFWDKTYKDDLELFKQVDQKCRELLQLD